jgi:hypothetical protein
MFFKQIENSQISENKQVKKTTKSHIIKIKTVINDIKVKLQGTKEQKYWK